MAQPGRQVVAQLLPTLRRVHKLDLVIAQAENVTHGIGMSPQHMRELQAIGVDVFSGGNHSIRRPALHPLLDDPGQPVLAPANMKNSQPNWGAKLVDTQKGKVLVISLLGAIVPKALKTDNPLQVVDSILAKYKSEPLAATIVNFHGDYSSEKRVIGYYLDGRASAVIGDHWHVPTADAMILPGGTAHITDVGMCGTLHSSLGVSKEIIIARWQGEKNKNDIAEGGPYQFNSVLVAVNTQTGLAISIEPIRHMLEQLG